MTNYVIDDLLIDNLKIFQDNDLYKFSSDSVILANFAKMKKNDLYVDLCSGSGIVTILASYKNQNQRSFGVEIQKELFEMSNKTLEINNLVGKINFINEDIKNFKDLNVLEKYNLKNVDVITCNPPYKKNCQIKNLNPSKQIARHEVLITMEEIIEVSQKMLKFGGSLYIMYDADRTAELIYKLKKFNLEPKIMFFTQSDQQKEPTLIFVKAIKGGKESVRVLPNLIVNDKNGKYIETLKDFSFK